MESDMEIRNTSLCNDTETNQAEVEDCSNVSNLLLDGDKGDSNMDVNSEDSVDSRVKEEKTEYEDADSVGLSECSAGPNNVKDSSELHSSKIKMLARVAVSNAHFKHQQRGEPDLTLQDKIEIAQNVLEQNKVSFLSRFGNFLEMEDLVCFSDLRTSSYEIDFYCKQIEKSKSSNFSKNLVKNRRYQAMKELISKNEYFSDEEMKFREPFLFHQMVGQYLTDDEIQAGIDKTDLRFSTILVKHIDQLNENDRYSRDKDKEECQEEEEEDSDEEDEMDGSINQKTTEDESDEDEEKISDHHKLELRAEFLSIMQEKFLHGQDKSFNYSDVDNNEAYDDLSVLSHDSEEKYFDDEDPESIHSDSNM